MSIATSALRQFAPNPSSSIRCIFFPHAGGAASYYRSLAMSLESNFDTFCVQYPGRQDRRNESLGATIPEIADPIWKEISRDSRPFVAFGHSMGSLVAYEALHQIQDNIGSLAVGLIASSACAPSVQRSETLHTMDDSAIIAELKKMGGLSEAVLSEPEILRDLIPIMRSDYSALSDYVCIRKTMLNCPISSFTGRDDPIAPRDCVAKWAYHTKSLFRLSEFVGDHFYLSDCIPLTARAIIINSEIFLSNVNDITITGTRSS